MKAVHKDCRRIFLKKPFTTFETQESKKIGDSACFAQPTGNLLFVILGNKGYAFIHMITEN